MPIKEIQRKDGSIAFHATVYNPDGVRTTATCDTIDDIYVAILQKAGQKSADEMAKAPVTACWKWFVDFKKQQGTGRKTLVTYTNYASPFVDAYGAKPIGEVTIADCRAALDLIQARFEQGAVHYSAVNIIRQMLRLLVFRGAIRQNPMDPAMALLQYYQPTPPVIVPEEFEFRAMMSMAKPRVALQMVMLARYGIVPDEMSRMVWPDINDTTRTVFVRAPVKMGDDPDAPAGRNVPYGDDLVSVLSAWKEIQGEVLTNLNVFTGDNGAPVTREQLSLNVTHLQIKADIVSDQMRQVRWQKVPNARYKIKDWRNMAAVRWIGEGKRLSRVAHLLGRLKVKPVWRDFRKYFLRHEPALDPARPSAIIDDAIARLGN